MYIENTPLQHKLHICEHIQALLSAPLPYFYTIHYQNIYTTINAGCSSILRIEHNRIFAAVSIALCTAVYSLGLPRYPFRHCLQPRMRTCLLVLLRSKRRAMRYDSGATEALHTGQNRFVPDSSTG